jgi:hypothetical protein
MASAMSTLTSPATRNAHIHIQIATSTLTGPHTRNAHLPFRGTTPTRTDPAFPFHAMVSPTKLRWTTRITQIMRGTWNDYAVTGFKHSPLTITTTIARENLQDGVSASSVISQSDRRNGVGRPGSRQIRARYPYHQFLLPDRVDASSVKSQSYRTKRRWTTRLTSKHYTMTTSRPSIARTNLQEWVGALSVRNQSGRSSFWST